MEQDAVTELTPDQCWELLAAQQFGRLAFHLVGEVHITPINYVVDDRRLVFRTAEGNKLLGVTMDADVAFEIDEIDEETARSVVVRGQARTLGGQEARRVDQLPLRPWLPGGKYNVVAIEAAEVTGRVFHLKRPWRHMVPEA